MNARRMIWVLALAGLAGCAQQGPQKPQLDASKRALDQAIASTPQASQAKSVEQALLPPLTVEMPRVDGKPVDTRFDLAVNNALASEVFMAIVSGTRYSMAVHPSVKERISVNLKDVTVIEALDTIREMYGYEYTAKGNRIFIQPITLQTRMFQINYLTGTRKGKSEIRVSSGAISDTAGQTQAGAVTSGTSPTTTVKALESSRVEMQSDANFWSDLSTSLRAIVGTDGGRNVIVNVQSGLVLVRALPVELRQVDEFLRAMQGVVARQVMLEAKIVEVQLSDSFATGVNWAAFIDGKYAAGVISPGTRLGTDGNLTTYTNRQQDGQILPNSAITAGVAKPSSLFSSAGVPGTVFGLALQTSNFAALLGFLETQGTLQVLSSPRIATLNNTKAVLKVGTDEFFVTNITTNQTTTVGGAVQNSPSITVQPFFSGVALDVTPQIDENNEVILHVHPSVSLVTNKTTDIDLGTSGIFRLPLASSDIRETDTIVKVTNGNIVAIGGLMGERTITGKSGMPWVGDIPVVGNLFKNTDRRIVKTELVILLKPTIIASDESWKPELRELRQRLEDMQFQPPPNLLKGDSGQANKQASNQRQ